MTTNKDNDTSERSGCHRKRPAGEMPMNDLTNHTHGGKKFFDRSVGMKTVTYKNLMNIGFPEHTARNIIREAKRIAVKKFEEARKVDYNAVQLSKSPLDNRRLGIAPKDIVEELIGISLSEESLESEN